MNDHQNQELTKCAVGIENGGRIKINHEDGHKIFIAPPSRPTTMDIPGRSTYEATGVKATYATINNPTYNMIGGQPSEPADPIKEILRAIHENTWRKTQVNIGETFKRDKFPEPDFEVHPQMAESPNFYKGGHKVVDSDDIPQIGYYEMEKRRRKPEMVKKAEYKKDAKFTFSDGDDDDDQHSHPLSAESLMKKIHEKKEKLGVLGIVAQAGAGKTTCMRRWARHTMAMSGMRKENIFTASKNSRFQLVHFIDLKSVEISHSTSLQEFLFNGLFCDVEAKKAAYNWIFKNQDKAVIFLDGLDQTQSITKPDERTVNHQSLASSRTLLFNLLSRNHLPGVRLVVSSREHSATSLPDEAKFDEVITLTGFSKEDAKKLFNVITAEDNIDDLSCDSQTANVEISNHSFERNMTNWDKLNKTSSGIIPFVSIPVFLIFTAIVFKDHGSVPSTLTDLMVKVIQALKYSTTHSTLNQEHKNVRTIINKLKKLSHEGMDKGFVMFSEDDMEKCELKTEDIRDLLLKIIKSRSLYVLEGDNVFFFCHQIIQEFLSACYIVEMSLEDFKEFVQSKLNKEHWSVVRRFVCGLIFTKSWNEKLLDICDKNEKQQFLHKNLTNLLKEVDDDDGYDDMPLELYAAIYESNDDQVIQTIRKFDLTEYYHTQDATHLIGSLLALSGGLDSLIMTNDVLEVNLPILTECLQDCKVPIKRVHILDDMEDVSNFNKFLQHIVADEIELTVFHLNSRFKLDWLGSDLDDAKKLNVQGIKKLTLMNRSFEGCCFTFDNLANDDSIKVHRWYDRDAPYEEEFGIYRKNDATLKVYLNTADALEEALVLLVVGIVALHCVSFEPQGVFTPQKLHFYRHGLMDTLLSLPSTDILTQPNISFTPQEILIAQKFQSYGFTFFKVSEVLGQVDEVIVVLHKRWYGQNKDWIGRVLSFVYYLQVKILTIKIDLEDAREISPPLVDMLHTLNCELKIHVVVYNEKSLQDLSTLRKSAQIERLYCTLRDVEVTMKDFKSFIGRFENTEILKIRNLDLDCRGHENWMNEITPLVSKYHVFSITITIGPEQINQVPASLKNVVKILIIHVKASDISSLEELSAQIQGHKIESLTIPLPNQTTVEDLVTVIKLMKDIDFLNVLISADMINTIKSWKSDTDARKQIRDACEISGISLFVKYEKEDGQYETVFNTWNMASWHDF